MDEFVNISLNELNTYLGTIALYSLKGVDGLGENVKAFYPRLFSNNFLTVYDSIAKECEEDLIIIDGDDFNPSKVFGLTKKYTRPIVIFVSNNSKIEKLKNLLLREVLVVNKNTIQSILYEEDIKRNIQAKEEKDARLQKIAEEKQDIANTSENSITSVEDDNNTNIKANSDIPQTTTQDEQVKNIEVIDVKKEDASTNKIERDIISNSILRVDGLDAIDIRPQEFKDSFVEDDKLEDDVFMQMPTREENPTYIQGHLKNDLRVRSLGMFGISIEIQSQVKMLFEETGTINAHSDKKYDVYFIDVSYASQRIFNLIEKALPAPMILMSNFPESFNRLKYIDCASILIIKKPFEYQPEDFKKILIDYLENYNLEEEKQKIENFNTGNIPRGLEDDERKTRIRNEYTNAEFFSSMSDKEKSIEKTKETINKKNKRFDKDISLEDIYKDLGLNKIAIFQTQINREVYSTQDGKVVKYKPDGYLIEIRLNRLKSKGLSSNEIGNAMQRLEEADIRFERKLLKKMEVYKIKQEREKKLAEKQAK